MRLFLTLLLMLMPSAPPPQTSGAPADDPFALVSRKELGCIVRGNETTFRLFAPRATAVRLVLYDAYDAQAGSEVPMARDRDGVWEHTVPMALAGKLYGYRVSGPGGPGEMFDDSIVVADPYSHALVTKNTYHQEAKSLIVAGDYDWEGDASPAPADPNALIIYEGHVRDLTAHPTSGIAARGTYAGLAEPGKPGGLAYLKRLGVTALELLPVQKFGTIEIPFRDPSARTSLGEMNTWNPYERNHWGYMTSCYFAPETYYAAGGTMERGRYNGVDGAAGREFKDLVKTLHREGIAVLMDVVYNHVSEYDYNPFKYIDKKYYFHCDSAGNFIRQSGCGNDFYTERPMARRLIIESVLYWMREYHVDGFRFDIATLIDRETCRQIAAEARKLNPNVVLIAEAWGGGGYDPPGFSDIGWASWNDRFRNGIKGQNPDDGLGFIFGKMQGGNTKASVMSFFTGTLRADGGMYLRKEHSINYLESHDDYTLGDFIRLGTGEVKKSEKIADPVANARLSPRQLALHKLAALALLGAQGPLMIAEGQEFGRSKLIAPTSAPDPNVGMLDHNSYEKDNETNYLNYNFRTLNGELFEYYRGLIALRRASPALSNAANVTFLPTADDYHVAFTAAGSRGTKRETFLVALNGNGAKTMRLKLPDGNWGVAANAQKVSPARPIRQVKRTVTVPPVSGMILRKVP